MIVFLLKFQLSFQVRNKTVVRCLFITKIRLNKESQHAKLSMMTVW